MSPRVPPQEPPTFQYTPQSLLDEARAIIERSKKLEDGIVMDVNPENATFQNVLEVMAEDENERSLTTWIIGFYRYVSGSKELRDASTTARKELDVCLPVHLLLLSSLELM